MEFDAVMLSRIQFAFTITFHIIFPSFTIGLAAWLALLDGRWLVTGNPYYRQLFDFWLKVFGVSFGMGVVSGIVMAFQFGTNWSVLAERAGPIQGPLLGYETFTAFLLEATFFGVMLFGRNRVAPWFYSFSCAMVALGTTFSAYWILMNNSWMQVPIGHQEVDGRFIPASWHEIVFSYVGWIRFLHMLIGAYLTSAMCIAAAGAWLLLRGRAIEQSHIMIRSGLGLVAVLIWPQMILGHFNGEYVHDLQPAKFAAIEARWETQQPASETLIGIPDPDRERNLYALDIPKLGSFIASGTWDSREVGLKSFPPEDRPPVIIPFFAFRIMVGMALVMWGLSWFGVLQWIRRRAFEDARWFLWLVFVSFPTGFVAVISGWYVAEVGRQPWVVYGLLRTVDAHSPNLTVPQVATSLALFVVVYGLIFVSGAYYIYRILRAGPEEEIAPPPPPGLSGSRPLAAPGASPGGVAHHESGGVTTMEALLPFIWAGIIALSILLYVILDGFDLGVGVLFGTTRHEPYRRQMMTAVAPVWDGNETWLVVIGTGLFAAFPVVYAIFLSALYLPVILLLIALIFRGVAFEFRYKSEGTRWVWDLGFFLGSLVAAFVQGAAIGAMVDQLPVENNQFVGSTFFWLTPFAIFCGIGLILGYCLLGAGWLVLKTEGPLRAWAYRRVLWLLGAVLVFLAIVFVYALAQHLSVMDRWVDRPVLYVFPIIGALAAAGVWRGVQTERDHVPFLMTVVIFLCAFGTMAVSFWPYMVPYSITIEQAAAPTSSLEFLFWGAGLVVLPIILIYTATVYWIFRGKIHEAGGYG